ncbi:MAG: nuclear transport factor 2 family protein [Gemmatimonadaceae bacterium]
MHSAHVTMKSARLALVAVMALAACGAPAKKDPDAPALEPAVINMPSDAQKSMATKAAEAAAVPASTLIPADSMQRVMAVSQGYALATAMMINQDARMLSGLYAADATLSLPDSTVKGVESIVRQLTALARTKSLAEFQRTTKGMRIVDDSTLADSGTWVMTLKRTPKDSVFERGRYATSWRARGGGPGSWVMIADRITPDTRKGRR